MFFCGLCRRFKLSPLEKQNKPEGAETTTKQFSEWSGAPCLHHFSLIDELSQAIQQEAERIPEVKLLLTHPGVGAITVLAFVLVIGTPDRFGCGRQVASYLVLIPCEDSSSERWRLGHITKQGNAQLRFLLGQAAQSVARCEEQWQRQYVHLKMRRNKSIAKVAMARKLAVRLFWMWRKEWDYQQLKKFGSRVG